MEPGLEAVDYYDPPNMTYPFGAYICVVDIDNETGETKVRRFYALDDCGTRINPMVIEGQVHGGLTEAFGIAMGQEIAYDAPATSRAPRCMDFFLPTAVETPVWETDYTVTPSPHHPIGAKGVGESPNVGGVPAFSNAVIDAFAHLGVTHMPMPHDAWRVWKAAQTAGAGRLVRRWTAQRGRGAAGGSRLHRRADLAMAMWLMHLLGRPLLLEGEAGVGKTEIAKALAAMHGDQADPPAVLRRAGRQRRALRVELSAPAARDQGARDAPARTPRRSSAHLSRTSCSSGRCWRRSGRTSRRCC